MSEDFSAPPPPPGGMPPAGPPAGGPPPGGMPPGPPAGNPYQPPGAPLSPPMPSTGQPPLPWDERQTIGYPKALIDTVKLVITEPRNAFSRLRPDQDYLGPLLFGLIISWIMAVIGQIWNLLFAGAMTGMFSDTPFAAMFAGGGIGEILITTLLWPIIYVVIVLISTGLVHLGLMVCKGLDQSPFGFEGTFKVVCYAGVANLASIVPIIGGFIGAIAYLVLLVIGLEAAHRTTTAKAAIGALAPFVLCCLCFGLIFAVAGAGMMSAMSGMQ